MTTDAGHPTGMSATDWTESRNRRLIELREKAGSQVPSQPRCQPVAVVGRRVLGARGAGQPVLSQPRGARLSRRRFDRKPLPTRNEVASALGST